MQFLYNCSRCIASSSPLAKKAVIRQYIQRQLRDEFCIKAREHSYRARSAFKLIEMNEKYRFIKPGFVVVDLGAAPGSWCQVLSELVNTAENSKAYVLGIDMQPMQPLLAVDLLSLSDITKQSTHNKIASILSGRAVDAVVSDMAPNPTGDRGVDHERILDLCKKAADLFCRTMPVIPLKKNGTFLCKIWEGTERENFIKYLRRYFETVTIVKPKASRDNSSEIYLLARKFK